jgi:hypothetical protein
MIGYSILYINNDTTVNDAIRQKNVVYSTWEMAVEQAMARANEEKNRYDDSYIISLVSSNSKNNCESYGNTQVFTVQLKEYGKIGSLHIVPVFDQST